MFYFNKIQIVGLVIHLCIFASKTEGSCNLKVENNLNGPLLMRKFGSKAILYSNPKSTIELDPNERIDAYCGSGFRSFQIYDNNYGQRKFEDQSLQKLRFECYSDRIYYYKINTDLRRDYLFNNPTIACKGATYSMFESKDTLLNCKNAMSYILGAKSNTPIILAGLCYDLDKLNLNYVNYKLQNQSTILENTMDFHPVGTNANSMLQPLNNIERFFEFPSNEFVKKDIEVQSKSNLWLNVADYEIGNIIQTNAYYKATLNVYSNFLDIFWWHPLRIGNWNRFVKLLEKRADVLNYIIYSGTSGVVKIPRDNNCLENTNLEINFTGNKRNVPQFIWTYLESIDDNIIEDFVVIAYNSPYFEYFPKNSTVLCNDMCDDIEWMKIMKDSRYISTLGVLYCCRPEEIVGHLHGFPKTLNETKIVAATISPIHLPL